MTLFREYSAAGECPPARLGAELFAGALVVHRGLDETGRLASRARQIVASVFGEQTPETAEQRLAPDTFQALAARARRLVCEDAEIERRWRALLVALGYEPEALYRDRMRLRVVPSRASAWSRTARPLAAHRDTWGSGVMAQVNWWLPLYPLAPGRTMTLWPEAFAAPLANDSGTWDYDALLADRRGDYPLLPLACETPPGPAEPVLLEPGDLLAFSAAHVHAGSAEDAGITRFSLDTRTVWQRDLDAGRGAPDVDGPGCAPRWAMFPVQPADRNSMQSRIPGGAP